MKCFVSGDKCHLSLVQTGFGILRTDPLLCDRCYRLENNREEMRDAFEKMGIDFYDTREYIIEEEIQLSLVENAEIILESFNLFRKYLKNKAKRSTQDEKEKFHEKMHTIVELEMSFGQIERQKRYNIKSLVKILDCQAFLIDKGFYL